MEEAVGGSVCNVESHTEKEERYFILIFTEHLQQPVLLIYSLPFKITVNAPKY